MFLSIHLQAALFAVAVQDAEKLSAVDSEWEVAETYDDMNVQVKVKDPFRHVEVAIQIVIKDKTVGAVNGPPRMIPENWVFTNPNEGKTIDLPNSYVVHAIEG